VSVAVVLIPLILLVVITVPAMRALRRRERDQEGGPVPSHLKLMTWALRNPWTWAAVVGVLFGLVVLIGSHHVLRGVAVAVVVFVLVGLNGRFGAARWLGTRKLSRYEER
jgi:asparagine N-glycosylation enzyme membrane subunit Stt3